MNEERCFCCRLLPEDREWLERAWRAFSGDKRRQPVIEIRGQSYQPPSVVIVRREVYGIVS